MLDGKDPRRRADYTSLARTITLLHAYSVDLYRQEFQPRQNGTIGVTLVRALILSLIVS